jgi:hypothetical protein
VWMIFTKKRPVGFPPANNQQRRKDQALQPSVYHRFTRFAGATARFTVVTALPALRTGAAFLAGTEAFLAGTAFLALARGSRAKRTMPPRASPIKALFCPGSLMVGNDTPPGLLNPTGLKLGLVWPLKSNVGPAVTPPLETGAGLKLGGAKLGGAKLGGVMPPVFPPLKLGGVKLGGAKLGGVMPPVFPPLKLGGVKLGGVETGSGEEPGGG